MPGPGTSRAVPHSAQEILETTGTAALLLRVDRAWRGTFQHAHQPRWEESGNVLRNVLDLVASAKAVSVHDPAEPG